jgi:hypothetical protein
LEDDDQSPSEIITERPPAGLQVPRDLQFQKKRQFHPWDDGKQAGSDRQSFAYGATAPHDENSFRDCGHVFMSTRNRDCHGRVTDTSC